MKTEFRSHIISSQYLGSLQDYVLDWLRRNRDKEVIGMTSYKKGFINIEYHTIIYYKLKDKKE